MIDHNGYMDDKQNIQVMASADEKQNFILLKLHRTVVPQIYLFSGSFKVADKEKLRVLPTTWKIILLLKCKNCNQQITHQRKYVSFVQNKVVFFLNYSWQKEFSVLGLFLRNHGEASPVHYSLSEEASLKRIFLSFTHMNKIHMFCGQKQCCKTK